MLRIAIDSRRRPPTTAFSLLKGGRRAAKDQGMQERRSSLPFWKQALIFTIMLPVGTVVFYIGWVAYMWFMYHGGQGE
jgi:hypothetical protein